MIDFDAPPTPATDALRSAVYYVRYGRTGPGKQPWHIFPCSAETKRPLLANWPEMATRDEDQVVAWWGPGGQYEGAAIGLAHRLSGTVSLDIDTKHGDGFSSVLRLEDAADGWSLADQPVPAFETASGGEQCIFRRRPQDGGSGNTPLSRTSGLDLPNVDLVEGFSLLPSGHAVTPGRQWLEGQAPHLLPPVETELPPEVYRERDAERWRRDNFQAPAIAASPDAGMLEKRATGIISYYAELVGGLPEGGRQAGLASVSHKLGQSLGGLGAQYLEQRAVEALATAAPWADTRHERHTIETGIRAGFSKPIPMDGDRREAPMTVARELVRQPSPDEKRGVAVQVAAELVQAGATEEEARIMMEPWAHEGEPVDTGDVRRELRAIVEGAVTEKRFMAQSWAWERFGVCIELTDLAEKRGQSIPAVLTVTLHGFQVLGPQTLNLLSGPNIEAAAKQLRGEGEGVPWHMLLQKVVRDVYGAARAIADLEMARPLSSYPMPTNDAPLLDPLVRDGEVTMLIGAPGAGKSFVTLGVAAALAGRYDAFPLHPADRRPRKVLVVDSEWSPEAWRGRMVDLLGSDEELPNLHYLRLVGKLADKVDHLRAYIAYHGIEYVVVDSVGGAVGGDPNDASTAIAFMEGVRALGVGALVVHHVGKASWNPAADDDSVPTGFGSAYFTALARAVWMVRRSKEAHPGGFKVDLLCTKSNSSAVGPAPFQLCFTFHGKASGAPGRVAISRRELHGERPAPRPDSGPAQRELRFQEAPMVLRGETAGLKEPKPMRAVAPQPRHDDHEAQVVDYDFDPAQAALDSQAAQTEAIGRILEAEGVVPVEDFIMTVARGCGQADAVGAVLDGGGQLYLKPDGSLGLRRREAARLDLATIGALMRAACEASPALRPCLAAALVEHGVTGGKGYPPDGPGDRLTEDQVAYVRAKLTAHTD